MANSFSCHCAERAKPATERAWFVVQRNSQCSAFDGYRQKYTTRSTVVCGQCGAVGRTAAAYVSLLPDAPAEYPAKFRFTRAELPRLSIKLSGFNARSSDMVGGDNEHALANL